MHTLYLFGEGGGGGLGFGNFCMKYGVCIARSNLTDRYVPLVIVACKHDITLPVASCSPCNYWTTNLILGSGAIVLLVSPLC